jgi:hypothetical protein
LLPSPTQVEEQLKKTYDEIKLVAHGCRDVLRKLEEPVEP